MFLWCIVTELSLSSILEAITTCPCLVPYYIRATEKRVPRLEFDETFHGAFFVTKFIESTIGSTALYFQPAFLHIQLTYSFLLIF